MTDKHRTAFQEAADAPTPNRLQRLERLLFRRHPLRMNIPLSAQVDDPRTFQPTEEGSGAFGRWKVDEAGLPAYQYEMDQYDDPRAAYPTTLGISRRDHWHQVGNRRITALASNDGTVQVYLGDRGGVFLNRFEAWKDVSVGFRLRNLFYRVLRALFLWLTSIRGHISPNFTAFSSQSAPALPPRGIVPPDIIAQMTPAAPPIQAQATASQQSPPDNQFNYAGGFGYLDDGRECWATAYRYRPPAAQTRRVFGTGYFETEITHNNIRVTRKVYAPFGDNPFLIADIEIQNLNAHTVDLRHYEYWDVNVHQLQLEWLRAGSFAKVSDALRHDINKHFDPSVEWDETHCALRFSQRLRQPAPPQARPPHEPSDVDWDPANVFLAALGTPTNGWYVDKAQFFGAGGARRPDAITQRHPCKARGTVGDDPMPYCLVLRTDLSMQRSERRTLRFAYGTVRPEKPLDFLQAFRLPDDTLNQTLAEWKDKLAYFYTGEDPVLHREFAWHAYNMLSSTVYLDFFKVHVVPQGSAYLYSHGADGAPRDQALFTLPAVYLDPTLARDMLRLIMQVTHADSGQINYAFGGHGFLSNGLNLHTRPADLDLFFLLAIAEYLCATGDMDFLREEVPYYPPQKSPTGATVHDHIRTAVRHLLEINGVGEHGLIKVGSGDWSDSIVLETAIRDGIGTAGVTYDNSKRDGESVPNTQMALYVLPLIASIMKAHDPQLYLDIHGGPNWSDRLDRLRAAVQEQWNAKGWYNRAVLRDHRNEPVVIDGLTLESQVWALISGIEAEADRIGAVVETIDEVLDRPSPLGGALVAGGMVWPAVSQLLTWGYARTNRNRLAWRSLNRNTFAMHGHVYPDIWINTWSGPDGVNGPQSDFPGGTWSSPVTPMTDFPIMNANQNAMALLGLLRVCGIEPAPNGDGLMINPHVPREAFTLDLPLLRLEVRPRRMLIEYRAVATAIRTLYIEHFDGEVVVTVDYTPCDQISRDGRLLVVPIRLKKGGVTRIEVTSL